MGRGVGRGVSGATRITGRAGRYTVAQARRASNECIFMLLGELIEHSRTEDLFLTPKNPKTAEYIEGRYG